MKLMVTEENDNELHVQSEGIDEDNIDKIFIALFSQEQFLDAAIRVINGFATMFLHEHASCGIINKKGKTLQ